MKLAKKICVLLALAILFSSVSVLFTGCGKDEVIEVDKKKTQIYVYSYNGGVGNDWLDDTIKAFEAKYVFVDKPYTVDVEEVKAMVEAAKKSGSLICGGSACKYAPDVVELAQTVSQLRQEGKLKTASMNFNIFMDIEYDGFFFYAAHLIEMAFTIFGKDMVSLQANRLGNTVIVNVEYADIQVSLHFTEGVFQSAATLYTKGAIIHKQFDISTIFDEELKVFVDMLHTGVAPFAPEEMIDPVVVADAIYRSYTTGQKIVF